MPELSLIYLFLTTIENRTQIEMFCHYVIATFVCYFSAKGNTQTKNQQKLNQCKNKPLPPILQICRSAAMAATVRM